MNTDALKKAVIHALKVFLYAGISAIIPVIISYMANDPRYLVFIPVINAVWCMIEKYLKEKQIFEAKVKKVKK